MRGERARSDAVDNRRRLVAAVGRVLAAGDEVTLARVTAEAGVSRSTTYRNFADPHQAVRAYVEDFVDAFEAAVAGDSTAGVDFAELCRIWGRLVDERSLALVRVRSSDGFLARVSRGDPVIGRIDRIVRGAISAEPRYRGFGPDQLDYAVFLWNLLLDPRELADLAGHSGCSLAEATERLTAEVLACLDRQRS